MFIHRLFGARLSIAGTESAQQRQRRKEKRLHATGMRRIALLEPLEPRLLLAASVFMDKSDYAAGATAIVSGSGFTPGETVQFQVLFADGTPALGSNPWEVEDGDSSFIDPYQDASDIWHCPDLDGQVDGNLQTTWYVDGADETNATMRLTATGLSSGELAQTTFTDSAMLANIGVAHDTGSSARARLSTSLTASVAVGKTMVVALTLNRGTIRDAAGNNANLTLIAPGSPMDNLYYQNIVVDTTAPVVSSLSVSPSPTGTAPTISAALTDVNSAATSRIAAGEYFVDVLGAAGTGTSLSLNPAYNSTCTGTAVLSGFSGLNDGPHTVYVRARDSAGNWSAAAHTSFVKDSAMPGVTLSAPVSPTNQDPIPFTVTFTQNVTGLSTAGFAATNGTVVGLSGSGAIYSVLVHPAASGVVTCQVLANAAENATVPGKFNTPSNVASVTYDGVAPTLSSLSLQYQSPGARMRTGSYVAFGLTFSEVVFVTGTPQLRLNTGASVNYSSGSGTTTLYFGTYFVVAGQNAAPLDFASDGALVGTIKDAAGNAVVLPTPGPSSLLYLKNITVDTTSP